MEGAKKQRTRLGRLRGPPWTQPSCTRVRRACSSAMSYRQGRWLAAAPSAWRRVRGSRSMRSLHCPHTRRARPRALRERAARSSACSRLAALSRVAPGPRARRIAPTWAWRRSSTAPPVCAGAQGGSSASAEARPRRLCSRNGPYLEEQRTARVRLTSLQLGRSTESGARTNFKIFSS